MQLAKADMVLISVASKCCLIEIFYGVYFKSYLSIRQPLESLALIVMLTYTLRINVRAFLQWQISPDFTRHDFRRPECFRPAENSLTTFAQVCISMVDGICKSVLWFCLVLSCSRLFFVNCFWAVLVFVQIIFAVLDIHNVWMTIGYIHASV